MSFSLDILRIYLYIKIYAYFTHEKREYNLVEVWWILCRRTITPVKLWRTGYLCSISRNDEKLQELLYIGRSNDVNDRPGPNHENYGEWRKQRKPGEHLYFSFADTKDEQEEKKAEAALIFHTKPRCNQTGKDGFHYPKTYIFTSGQNAGLDSSFTVQSTD